MRYALKYCTASEDAANGTVTYTGPCVVSGKSISVTVPKAGVEAYKGGAYLQVAFPDTSPGDREFLLSGISNDEYDRLFADA